MGRSDWIVGLNLWAREKLASAKREVRVIGIAYEDNCHEYDFDEVLVRSNYVKEEAASVIKGCYQNFPLYKYTFTHGFSPPPGTVWEEYVQATTWDSGPNFYLTLKDQNGDVLPESLWALDLLEDEDQEGYYDETLDGLQD